MITENERAYLAGLFDGEGCISITKEAKKGFAARVIIVSTNQEALQYWYQRVGLGSLIRYRPTWYKSHWNTRWDWKIFTRQAEEFINLIYPFLRIKKCEADVFLDFRRTYTDKLSKVEKYDIRLDCYTQMRGFHSSQEDNGKEIDPVV